MNAPLIEHRELAPRLEVQVRVVSGEPGAPMRLIDLASAFSMAELTRVTRVLIEFRDASGESWSTAGVSANIIDAPFQALTDAGNLEFSRTLRVACSNSGSNIGYLEKYPLMV